MPQNIPQVTYGKIFYDLNGKVESIECRQLVFDVVSFFFECITDDGTIFSVNRNRVILIEAKKPETVIPDVTVKQRPD